MDELAEIAQGGFPSGHTVFFRPFVLLGHVIRPEQPIEDRNVDSEIHIYSGPFGAVVPVMETGRDQKKLHLGQVQAQIGVGLSRVEINHEQSNSLS